MHPFDLRAALLAKHAQHVVIIHFPIALFSTGVVFDFVAHWRRSKALAAAACCNLRLGGILSVPGVVTGLLAWQWLLKGTRVKGTLLLHMVLGIASSVLLLTVGWLRFRTWRNGDQALPAYQMILEVLGMVVLAITGHLGGFLSGVNAAP